MNDGEEAEEAEAAACAAINSGGKEEEAEAAIMAAVAAGEGERWRRFLCCGVFVWIGRAALIGTATVVSWSVVVVEAGLE